MADELAKKAQAFKKAWDDWGEDEPNRWVPTAVLDAVDELIEVTPDED